MPDDVFDGRADRQSLEQLNRLLDEGWRISGIDPTLQRLPGVGNFKAFGHGNLMGQPPLAMILE